KAARHSTTLLVLRARDIWPITRPSTFLSLFIFTPAFLVNWSFIPSCLLRGLLLLDACVKRVINECGTLCGLIIILRQKGKSAADQLQSTCSRMVVQLAFDIRRLHDAGHLQQYRIVS